MLCTGTPNTLSVIKINVLLFTFVCVCFESFRRDLNEVKAVYISVMKINVLLFTFVCVCFESFRRDLNEVKAVNISVMKINVLLFTFVRVFFEYCYLSLLMLFLSHLEGI